MYINILFPCIATFSHLMNYLCSWLFAFVLKLVFPCIAVVESSPNGQVKPPLDQDPFEPRQKITNGNLLPFKHA